MALPSDKTQPPNGDPRLLNRQASKRRNSNGTHVDQQSQQKVARVDGDAPVHPSQRHINNGSARKDSHLMTDVDSQPKDGDPELEGRIYGLLMEFSARTSQLSTLKTAADLAQSRLSRAQDDFESSQGIRYKQFSAIREQKRDSQIRAQARVKETAQAVQLEMSIQEKAARTLAALMAQNNILKNGQRVRDARVEEMSRDLVALRHDVRQIREVNEAEWQEIKAKLDSCNERISQSFTTLSQRLHECESKLQSARDAHELELNDISKAVNRLGEDYKRLEIKGSSSDKKLEDLSERCKRIDDESVEKGTVVSDTFDKINTSLAKSSEDLSLRLDQLEAANSHSALQRDLDGVIATVSRLEDKLRAVQTEHEKLSSSSNGQAAAYSVSSFMPATPTRPQENCHPLTNGSHSHPAGTVPDEVRQLKAGHQSLKQRLDNLTTDHVVKQMIDQLHHVYPDTRNWQEAVNRFTREITELRHVVVNQNRDHKELSKALGDARGATNELRDTVQHVDNTIRNVEVEARNASQELAIRLEMHQKETLASHDKLARSLTQLGDRTERLDGQLRELANRK